MRYRGVLAWFARGVFALWVFSYLSGDLWDGGFSVAGTPAPISQDTLGQVGFHSTYAQGTQHDSVLVVTIRNGSRVAIEPIDMVVGEILPFMVYE